MRLASFNVENLFARAKALNMETWQDGRAILERSQELNDILNRVSYDASTKRRIAELVTDLGLSKSDESSFVILRQNRGKLLKRPRAGGLEVVADGRADWIGWVELKLEAVDERATQMTARVIRDVAADVIGLVEADNRPSLVHFNRMVLPAVDGAPYAHIMLIDGNDERGIDVALMTRQGYTIGNLRSHVDDREDGDLVFSRDCPEYEVIAPDGQRIVILVNHFKSKGFGTQASSDRKRKIQATRVREIYDMLSGGMAQVAIIGDLNDTPASAPLAPLLADGTLKDISQHPAFQDDGHPGTFKNGTASNKIDYILLSPALFAKVTAGGVFRKGVWGGARGDRWPIYPEMEKEQQAASDHAAIWADIAL